MGLGVSKTWFKWLLSAVQIRTALGTKTESFSRFIIIKIGIKIKAKSETNLKTHFET